MRPDEPSRTALWVAALRAAATGLPAPRRAARDDVAPELLTPGLRRLALGIRDAPFHGAIYGALDRATFGLTSNVVLRTLRLDDLVGDAIANGCRQLVLVGAGFDARAFRLPGLEEVVAFEVDHPSTQRVKRARLGHRRPCAKRIEFVPVDFERQRLDDELVGAGFDAAVPSVFVWEGVTMYLTDEARRGTITSIGGLSAPGSDFLITYAREVDRALLMRSFGRVAGRLIGEPVPGWLTSETIAQELRDAGFDIVEDGGGVAWGSRYWPQASANAVRAWERIVVGRRRTEADRAEPAAR